MNTIAHMIQDKAYALGYEKCGIIPLQALEDYSERLEERIEKVPESKPFYQRQKRFTNLRAQYPWAKSAVVAVAHYAKYKIPEPVKGHVGKFYLFDFRVDGDSKESQNRQELEQYMEGLGLNVASEKKFGVFALRWAAMKAGLGIIRNNNFFYTESGSWVALEGWLTDQAMELIETPHAAPCPKGCNRCVSACPSGSLVSSHTMAPGSCVSYLTTLGGRDLPHQSLGKTFGNWIYGCDTCQDVCPMNKGKWAETADFPGIADLAPYLTPENIMAMDENFYQQYVQPRFFYLTAEELWKWQVNALCFMQNRYEEKYKQYIIGACENENERVREMAQHVCQELDL